LEINVNTYQENGFDDRDQYLSYLSDEYEVPYYIVYAVADMFGESEDFDGLVTELENLSDEYRGC
jgi:hypothetical protein